MNERITIGITCYNAQSTIARAIESALAQDYPDFEIVIVDDCSRDNSVAVVQGAIENHEHARLIRHDTNQGAAAARNTIIREARGAFIAFFDDDDEALPPRIRTQMNRILSYEEESGESLIACYASGTRLYPNGYEFDINAIGSRPIIPQGAGLADYILFFGRKKDWFYGAGTPTCALMARKSTFEAVGGFDESFRRVEDLDFAVRLALMGGHFIGCPEKLFIQHATEGSDKAPAKNMEAEIALAEKYKTYLQSVGRYEYARRWPLIRYHHFTGHHGRMLRALCALFLRAPFKVLSHIAQTVPRRWRHERKMKGQGQR